MIHVFLDTETTGLGPFTSPAREDQIIEVAFIWREKGKIKAIQELCNPGKEYLRIASTALDIQVYVSFVILALARKGKVEVEQQ